ncbi:hypothetical protein [Fortiea contorta]|uniref:hypothetical protein n=1 Tax=Fortiea contorta TaxID=1892405 RepID=UPI0003472089|nr:hypothetical protein [Fortiea contorta]
MYNVFRQLPIKTSICLLSLINLHNLIAAPANAQQAVASGAVSIVSPTGAYQGISGELFLPVSNSLNPGTKTTLTITPTFTNFGATDEKITSLSLTLETSSTVFTNNHNSLLNQAVQTINNPQLTANPASIQQTINNTNSSGALE